MLFFQIFINSLELGNWEFESLVDFIFSSIMRTVFQAQHVCRRDRVTQFMIKMPVFMEKTIHIYMAVSCHFK